MFASGNARILHCGAVYFDADDPTFRAGACHGALWLSTVAQQMAAEAHSPQEIAAHLAEMNEVLIEWKNTKLPMPDGPPWQWEADELEHFISMHKNEW